MLFVNKETEMFSLKKSFSTKFVNQMGFFNYPSAEQHSGVRLRRKTNSEMYS